VLATVAVEVAHLRVAAGKTEKVVRSHPRTGLRPSRE
jgi:hypothetical protein